MIELDNLYFAFDGIDGCGKSSAVKYFDTLLQSKYKQEVLLTREIGGTALAEDIRELVIRKSSSSSSAVTDLLLIEAARNDQRQYLYDRMSENPYAVVVSDRCEASTFAYQVYTSSGIIPLFEEVESHHPIRPSVYVYLQVDPIVAFDRLSKRGISDKFEAKGLEFFTQVFHGYECFFEDACANGDEVVYIDANGSIENTNAQLDKLAASVINFIKR